jgi:hypothetical protein
MDNNNNGMLFAINGECGNGKNYSLNKHIET